MDITQNYKISESPDFIQVQLSGRMTVELLGEGASQVVELLKRGPQKKVLYDTVSLSPEVPLAVKRESVKYLRQIDHEAEKLAVFYDDLKRLTLAKFIFLAAGVRNSRVFNDKDEAIKWLKNE